MAVRAIARRRVAMGLAGMLMAAGAVAVAGCGSDGGRGGAAATGGPVVAAPDPATGIDAMVASGRTDAAIGGTITYLQRIALPKDAVVVVSLLDLSRSPAAARIAENRFPAQGQVPIRFELPYDSTRVDTGHSYGVQAQILVDGALWFVNDRPAPVLTRGNPTTVQITLRPAPAQG
jgi:uncharacterized lipoprotein YbaY